MFTQNETLKETLEDLIESTKNKLKENLDEFALELQNTKFILI